MNQTRTGVVVQYTHNDNTLTSSPPQGVQRISLVRHGQTTWNEQGRFCGHTDIPLSTTGRKQARKLASFLQHRPIAAIYSSDLSRARETAEIIARKRPIDSIVSPAWREINFGAWEGLTYEEIAASSGEQQDFLLNLNMLRLHRVRHSKR